MKSLFLRVPAPVALLLILLAAPGTGHAARAQAPASEQRTFAPLTSDGPVPAALAVAVTLSFTGATLADAVSAIAKAAGVSLTFDPTLPGLDRRVSATFTRRAAASAIIELLDGTGIQAMASSTGQIVLVARPASRRAGVIEGRVRDATTRTPLGGARVELVGTRFATVTSDRGFFALRGVPVGDYTARISRLGFQPTLVSRLRLGADVDVPALDVPLELAPIALAAVVVTPGYFGMMESGLAAPQTMSRARIETVPQIGEDIYRAVNRLPGVTSTDFSADFYVRGGSGRELYVTLDGLELVEPFHLKDLGGGLSIIDSRAMGGVELITGGFSAEYGDRLTGVFGMRSLDPTTDRSRTSLGLSVMNARLMSQGQFGGGRGGWLVSARRGYLDLALKLANAADSLEPRYYDLFAKAQYDLGRAGRIAIHALDAGDALTYLDTPDPSIRSRYRSSYGWATWSGPVGSRLRQQTVASVGRLSWQRDGEAADRGTPTVLVDDNRSLVTGGVRQDWSLSLTDRALVKFGADVKRGTADYDYFSRVRRRTVETSPSPTVVYLWDTTAINTSPAGTYLGAYVAPRLRPLSSVTVEVGLRYDRSSHTGDEVVSPRINLAWQPRLGTTLRGAWGKYAQSQALSGLQALDGVDEFSGAERAEHRVIGLDQSLPKGMLARAELYERRLSDPRARFVSAGPSYEVFPEINWDRVRIAPTSGLARGTELLLSRDVGGRTDWSVSYALASASDRIDGRDIPRATDQRHTLAADWAFRPTSNRWRFSVAGVWHSGWPYTPAIVMLDTLENTPTSFSVLPTWVPGELNSERLPAYRRVDARYTRYLDTRNGRVSLFLEVYNLLDIHNRRGYHTNLSVDRQRRVTFNRGKEDWIPRLPTFGITYEFGGAGR